MRNFWEEGRGEEIINFFRVDFFSDLGLESALGFLGKYKKFFNGCKEFR